MNVRTLKYVSESAIKRAEFLGERKGIKVYKWTEPILNSGNVGKSERASMKITTKVAAVNNEDKLVKYITQTKNTANIEFIPSWDKTLELVPEVRSMKHFGSSSTEFYPETVETHVIDFNKSGKIKRDITTTKVYGTLDEAEYSSECGTSIFQYIREITTNQIDKITKHFLKETHIKEPINQYSNGDSFRLSEQHISIVPKGSHANKLSTILQDFICLHENGKKIEETGQSRELFTNNRHNLIKVTNNRGIRLEDIEIGDLWS